ITAIVEKRVLYRLLAEMDGDLAKEAETVFATASDEEKITFLQEKTDMARIMEEEVLKMKDELIREVEGLQPQE
ncbi:MAG: hypothetical protein Q7R79_01290, partial [bacterium]|nr:hypothetical protein [bacterium]